MSENKQGFVVKGFTPILVGTLLSGYFLFDYYIEGKRRLDEQKRRDERLELFLEQVYRSRNLTEIITKNVIGGSEPERFCDIDGKRFYFEIDGEQVEYWRGK